MPNMLSNKELRAHNEGGGCRSPLAKVAALAKTRGKTVPFLVMRCRGTTAPGYCQEQSASFFTKSLPRRQVWSAVAGASPFNREPGASADRIPRMIRAALAPAASRALHGVAHIVPTAGPGRLVAYLQRKTKIRNEASARTEKLAPGGFARQAARVPKMVARSALLIREFRAGGDCHALYHEGFSP
jgi:hypothetical protein